MVWTLVGRTAATAGRIARSPGGRAALAGGAAAAGISSVADLSGAGGGEGDIILSANGKFINPESKIFKILGRPMTDMEMACVNYFTRIVARRSWKKGFYAGKRSTNVARNTPYRQWRR